MPLAYAFLASAPFDRFRVTSAIPGSPVLRLSGSLPREAPKRYLPW